VCAAAHAVQAWDERHHASDKLRSAGAATVASAKRINDQYKVSERIGRGITSGMRHVTRKLSQGAPRDASEQR
jgi:hypothetical protein